MQTKRTRVTGRGKGYSLVELMVALCIFGFVMAGLIEFMLSSGKILFDSSIRTDIDSDMRRFTQRIMNDAQTADAFYLYKSFSASDRSAVDGSDRLVADNSGDFLLLVYTEPQPTTYSTVYITKLVGYFRKPQNAGDATTPGPIYRFELNYADQTIQASTSVLETLISSQNYDATDYPQVIPSVNGRYDNRFFYNLGECVMVSGNIYRGNASRSSTEIFRLTINP